MISFKGLGKKKLIFAGEMQSLEECCEILDSQRIPITGKNRNQGEYPYYGANGIQDYVDDYIFDDELVLLAEDGGNFGSKTRPIAYRVSGKCWVNNHAHVLKPKVGIDVDYLCYSLMFYNTDGLVNGATRQKLTQATMRKMQIPKRTMPEQCLIVEKLKKVQSVMQLRNKQLEELDTLINARFVEMFGDPKLNEKSWKQGIVSEYYLVKGGKRIPKGMGYADEITKHPYLRASDMKNETILDDDIHYISNEVFEYIKRYTVAGGDIYLTNVGVNLGMAGVIPEKYDGANLTENAVKLVPKQDGILNGIFLAHYINSPGIQEYINERKMSVGVPKLAIFRIETMPLLLPPIELQEEFNAFVVQINKSKVAVQKSLDELQVLFDSLMQEYFG